MTILLEEWVLQVGDNRARGQEGAVGGGGESLKI